MGWIIFAAFMILGIIAQIFVRVEENAPENSKEKKNAKIGGMICMWIGIAILVTLILYGLGWVWYYFCCGFLIFEEPNFFWKIIWGLFTIIPLGFFIGLIAICFGWDPWRK